MKQGQVKQELTRFSDRGTLGADRGFRAGRCWAPWLLIVVTGLVPVACRPAESPSNAGSWAIPAQTAPASSTSSSDRSPATVPAVDASPPQGNNATSVQDQKGNASPERPALANADVRPPVRPGLGGEGSETAPGTDPAERARRQAARPLRPGALNDITFDDLELDMPLGTLFNRSMLTPRAAQLDGQLVKLRGFIYAGGVFQQSGIKNFPFVKNTQCKFGPDGLAFCVILVDLDEGVTADFTTYPVTVEGRLTVQPYDAEGLTWSVYHLQGRRVF